MHTSPSHSEVSTLTPCKCVANVSCAHVQHAEALPHLTAPALSLSNTSHKEVTSVEHWALTATDDALQSGIEIPHSDPPRVGSRVPMVCMHLAASSRAPALHAVAHSTHDLQPDVWPCIRGRIATVMVSLLGMCLVSYGPGHRCLSSLFSLRWRVFYSVLQLFSVVRLVYCGSSFARVCSFYSDGSGSTGAVVSTKASGASAVGSASEVAVSTALAGDLLAVMSAAASGVYMVLLRVCVPNEEDIHMPSLFGMIGFVSAICFLPLFPILHFSGVEVFVL